MAVEITYCGKFWKKRRPMWLKFLMQCGNANTGTSQFAILQLHILWTTH